MTYIRKDSTSSSSSAPFYGERRGGGGDMQATGPPMAAAATLSDEGEPPPQHRSVRRLPAVRYSGGDGSNSSSSGSRSSSRQGIGSASRDSDLKWEMRDGALWVSGEIDLNEAGAFQEIAGDYIRRTKEPRLDLSGVEFIDSAGLAALLGLVRLAQREGKTLRAQVGGNPKRVLQITGFDKLLMVED